MCLKASDIFKIHVNYILLNVFNSLIYVFISRTVESGNCANKKQFYIKFSVRRSLLLFNTIHETVYYFFVSLADFQAYSVPITAAARSSRDKNAPSENATSFL